MARVKREHPGHSHGGTCWRTRAVLKKHLSDDFNRRCAYCDDRVFYCGGINSFHIDHFAPKSKFPKLEFEYKNLMYSCPYCNLAKSDKWPSDDSRLNVVGKSGFVDPCTDEYEEHLERAENGIIRAKTELGSYMVHELKLYLQRHAIFFLMDELRDRRQLLMERINDYRLKGKDFAVLSYALCVVNEYIVEYLDLWESSLELDV